MLIDQVFALVQRLITADRRWINVFNKFGLNIRQNNPTALANELDRSLNDLSAIAANFVGFEDMDPLTQRGIEPGNPARSLLFHALASHGVTQTPTNERLTAFPTIEELDILENYVYATAKESLDTIKTTATNLGAKDLDQNLAVVVFAVEYRRGNSTAHRKHADHCFSRTGIARVGNTAAEYQPAIRGFWPAVDDNLATIQVSPMRYSAYLAVRLTKNNKSPEFGPPRIINMITPRETDANRDFWVPLHKLFSGPECLQGTNLTVRFEHRHVNEKIRKMHEFFHDHGKDGGFRNNPAILNTKPFTIVDEFVQVVTLNQDEGSASVMVVPEVNNLVDPAVDASGNVVTYIVPSDSAAYSSSLELTATGTNQMDRHAPEYAHIRQDTVLGKKRPSDQFGDMNTLPKMMKLLFNQTVDNLTRGRAEHFIDHTGEGWILAKVSTNEKPLVTQSIPAYSLVAAPDFFPGVDQRAILEWAAPILSNPNDPNHKNVSFELPPDALSETRLPPNINLKNAQGELVFNEVIESRMRSVTALVAIPRRDREPANFNSDNLPFVPGYSGLPDSGAGVFSPGWDVSRDSFEDRMGTRGVPGFLTTYGLGSPFPEDSKLCAAIAGFWPAVAPDSNRTFLKGTSLNSGDRLTTTFLQTDDEIITHPWDGEVGPMLTMNNGIPREVHYPDFTFTDYTKNAQQNKFTMALTSKIDANEYKQRTLLMGIVKNHLSANQTRLGIEPNDLEVTKIPNVSGIRRGSLANYLPFNLLSFRKVPNNAPEVRQAQQTLGINLGNNVNLLWFGSVIAPQRSTQDFTRLTAKIERPLLLLVSQNLQTIVSRDVNGQWHQLRAAVAPMAAARPAAAPV